MKSPIHGIMSNVEMFDEVSKFPTLHSKFIWYKNGDIVPQTVDYLTSMGIVALAGEREAMLLDYKKIRELEADWIDKFCKSRAANIII
ncbi:MAG: hypothetical protein R3B45_16880 [Bdellovibrionota bacterium]